MGNSIPKPPELSIIENGTREVFVELNAIKKVNSTYFGSYVLFDYCIR